MKTKEFNRNSKNVQASPDIAPLFTPCSFYRYIAVAVNITTVKKGKVQPTKGHEGPVEE